MTLLPCRLPFRKARDLLQPGSSVEEVPGGAGPPHAEEAAVLDHVPGAHQHPRHTPAAGGQSQLEI